VPGTLELEQNGQALQEGGFQDGDLRCFIRRVCAWGGYAGIAARVIANNDLDAIRGHFVDAVQILSTNAPGVREALNAITAVHGLGVSFGSKHLRFLRPDLCPALDGNISETFGHALDVQGYRCLSQDCLKIADKLRECGVKNPMNRPDDTWFAGDVEMALFAFAQEWDSEP